MTDYRSYKYFFANTQKACQKNPDKPFVTTNKTTVRLLLTPEFLLNVDDKFIQ